VRCPNGQGEPVVGEVVTAKWPRNEKVPHRRAATSRRPDRLWRSRRRPPRMMFLNCHDADHASVLIDDDRHRGALAWIRSARQSFELACLRDVSAVVARAAQTDEPRGTCCIAVGRGRFTCRCADAVHDLLLGDQQRVWTLEMHKSAGTYRTSCETSILTTVGSVVMNCLGFC